MLPPLLRIEAEMKVLLLNVIALVVFAAGIAGLFVWESKATRTDKEFYQEVTKGHKSMY